MQLTVDISFSLLFLIVAEMTVLERGVDEVVIALGFAIALSFRRSAPLVALGGAWIVAIAQMAIGQGPQFYDIAVLAILYAVARYGGRQTRRFGLISAAVGALIAAAYSITVSTVYGLSILRPAHASSSMLALDLLFQVGFFGAILGLSWTVGLLVRMVQLSRESANAREHAEFERRQVEHAIAVEQERNRIARDMHDIVAHSLAVVVAQADGARYARGDDPAQVDQALTTISATAREALGEVRMLLGQLRHDQVAGPQPSLSDVGRLMEQMRSSGLVVRFSEQGIPETLVAAQQLAVFRILQEALTNALRHGDTAAPVEVRFEWNAKLAVTIMNDVPGAAADDRSVAGLGHGIPGMIERATLAGGGLQISTPDGRFLVTASFPVTATSGSTGSGRPAAIRTSRTSEIQAETCVRESKAGRAVGTGSS